MSTKKALSEIEKEYLEVSKLRAPLEARGEELSRRLLNPANREDFESASQEFRTNTEELLAISQRLSRLVDEMRAAIESEMRAEKQDLEDPRE